MAAAKKPKRSSILRAERPLPEPSPRPSTSLGNRPRKVESFRIRLTKEQKQLWTQAAEKAGRNLSDWLRYIANRATE